MADRFESSLLALARSEPIPAGDQVALADLHDLSAFFAAWQKLETGQRLAVLEQLAALAQADLRLDFSALFRAVARDDSWEVRHTALRANVEDESFPFLELLLDSLQRDPAPEVRAAAADCLAPFAYRAEVGELDDDLAQRIKAALTAAAEDASEDAEFRGAALAAVGYFSAPEVRALVDACLDHSELERAALRALGRSADSAVLDRVMEYSEDERADLRAEAAQAFGEIEDDQAVPRLVEMVDDPSPEVRLSAVKALGQIGGEVAREALLYAGGSSDIALVEAVERALDELETFED